MNTITTLRNTLFESLKKISAAKGEELDIEIKKAKAVIEVSSEILKSASIEADIMKTVKELNSGFVPDVVKNIQNEQLEDKKEPYKFGG